MSAGIQVLPEDLEQRASQITTAANNIRAAIENVQKEIAKYPEGVFDGHRADQLRSDFQTANAAMQEYEPTLQSLIKLLNDASTAFRSADRAQGTTQG